MRGLTLILAIAALLAAGTARAGERVRVADFALLDHEGAFHRLYYHSDAEAIVLFVQGNGCPIARSSLPALRALRERFGPRGVAFLMLNANPQDDRAAIAREAREFGIDFPILVDETQLVARALGITRTAEALLIDPDGWRVRFRGPVDDRVGYETQRPDATRHYLAEALEAQLAGGAPAEASVDSPGCLIFFPDREREASYADDVAPILKRRCRLCHYPDGVAPWAMTSYAAVRGWSSMMREVVLTRRMPPWHADPEVGRFSNDLALTPEETGTLVSWIDAGAPPGDGADPLADAPAAAPPEWPLGEPDLVLEAPAQALPATGVIDYRYERLEVPLDRDVWLRAVELKPANPAVMHHGTAFIRYPPGDPRRGEGPRITRGLFAAYVPGRTPRPFPDGTAVFLPARARLVLQLHYTTTGRPETDTPRLGLYFADGPVEHELRYAAAVNTRFRIPPGARDHEASSSYTFQRDSVLYRLSPHMHYRGRRMRFEARYPDGAAELLLSVPNYDFNWQRQYVLAEPKPIPAGTTIVCHAGFDNSAQNPANPDPTETVYWGEQSFDEMLIGYFLVRDAAPGELDAPGARTARAR